MSYSILLAEDAQAYYENLDEKSRRIVRNNLKKLEDDPYPRPGTSSGDREKLVVDGEEIYRLHVGRTHTAFYVILEAREQVRVVEILSIDDAHDRYGY